MGRNIWTPVAKEIPPVLETDPGRSEATTVGMVKVMNPDVTKACRRFHAEPLWIALCRPTPGCLPACCT
jgi:hypothetical protein